MSLTDTVTHLAHEASEVTQDLRTSAADLGRSAADLGRTAAVKSRRVAREGRKAAAKLPGVPAPRRRMAWKTWAAVLAVAGVMAALAAARRKRATTASELPAVAGVPANDAPTTESDARRGPDAANGTADKAKKAGAAS
jgi:hypothetical protein